MKRIVILGGGFAGVHTLLGLKGEAQRGNIHITLVSRERYFLFTPLLHEVVSGRVRAPHIAISLRTIVEGAHGKFLKEEVRGVDLRARIVQTDEGTVPFDVLVIALGSSPYFFGARGAERLPTLKTLSDAVALGTRLRGMIKSFSGNVKRIVIVGGGATGVEIASEIADIARGQARVTVLESKDDILSSSHETLRGAARRSLARRGVEVVTNCFVRDVKEGTIETKDGMTFPFDLAIWTAGVRPASIAISPPAAVSPGRRLLVRNTLQLPGHDNVFALGDIADGYPLTAQVATAQAKTAAKNIRALLRGSELKPFVYKHRGMLFSLGRWMAGAEVKIHLLNKVLYFWGFPAWLFWHFAYLMKIPGFCNKIRIAKDFLTTTKRPNA